MRQIRFTAISAFIVTVCFVQAAVGTRSYKFHLGPFQGDPDLWPFLSYPMYSLARYPGDEIDRYQVIGILADSSEVELSSASLDTDYWIWMEQLVEPLIEERPEDLEPIVKRYEGREGVRLVRLRLLNRPLILTADGVTEGSERLVRTIPIESEKNGRNLP